MHAGLAALVEKKGAALEGRRLLLYSYGSGLAASLWSVIGRRVQGRFALSAIARQVCWLALWTTSMCIAQHEALPPPPPGC